jgi:hypothetical protein
MISSPAWAQGTPSILLGPGTAALCFDVVPTTGDAPFGPILINRCTGATWLLVREDAPDMKGTPTGKFTFRWHPLGSAANEVILGPRGLPGSPSVPGAASSEAPENRPNSSR